MTVERIAAREQIAARAQIAAREQIAAARDECRQFDNTEANVVPTAGNPMLQIRLGAA